MVSVVAIRPIPSGLRSLLESVEGVEHVVYADSKGIPTGGIGHADKSLKIGSPVSSEQLEEWYQEDAHHAAQVVADHTPAAVLSSLPERSYVALLSFVFNVGEQAFVDPQSGKQTNFSRALNATTSDNYAAVALRMKDWDKITISGKLVTLRGLTARRAIESSEWLAGYEAKKKGEEEEPEPPAIPYASITSQFTTQPDMPAPPPDRHMIAAGAVATAGSLCALAPQLLPDPTWIANAGLRLVFIPRAQPYIAAFGAVLIIIGASIMIYRAVKQWKDKAA